MAKQKLIERRKWTPASFIILFIFLVAAFFCLFPLYAMIVASFKPGSYLVRYGLNRYVTLQPANAHSLYEILQAKLDQMAELQDRQTEQNNKEI